MAKKKPEPVKAPEPAPVVKKVSEKTRVINFLTENPAFKDKTGKEIAAACGVKNATIVSQAKTDMGLTKSRGGNASSGPVATKLDIASLKSAVSAAGSYEKLQTILEAVQKAGGNQAVAKAIDDYKALADVFEV